MTIQHQHIGKIVQKTPKTLFCHHMQCIFDRKRVQNGSIFFWQNPKFFYSLMNHKYSMYQKLSIQHHNNIFEKIGQKPPKTPFCHHMQCIYDPKRAKTAKTRFFLEYSLGYFIT